MIMVTGVVLFIDKRMIFLHKKTYHFYRTDGERKGLSIRSRITNFVVFKEY